MGIDPQRASAGPVDGNAAAGLLGELLAWDLTAATVTCAACASVGPLAEARLYGGSMGAILRCAGCHAAMIRLAHTPAGWRLDMRGARGLFVAAPAG